MLRLGRFLDATPDFWINPQKPYDPAETRKRLGEEIQRIRIHARAA